MSVFKSDDVVIPIFSGADYDMWKVRILTFLEYKKCHYVAIREKQSQESEEKWKQDEIKARNYVMGSVSNDILRTICKEETVRDMFKKLDRRYEEESSALQLVCRSKIESLKLAENTDPSQFFNEFDKAIDELKIAGAAVTEGEKVNYLLRSLPKTYSPYLADLMDVVTTEDRNVDFLKSKIMIRYKNNAENETKDESNIFVSAVKEQRRFSGTCNACGKYGHKQSECYAKNSGRNSNRSRSRGLSRGYGRGFHQGSYRSAYRGNYRGRSRGGNNYGRSNYGYENSESSDSRGQSSEHGCFLAEVNISQVTRNKYSNDNSEIEWILDSGCTDHIINSDKFYKEFVVLNEPREVHLGDGKVLFATKIGNIDANFTVGNRNVKMQIKNVYYVEQMKGNLLSFSAITENNFAIYSHGKTAKIYNGNGRVVAVCVKQNKLYRVTCSVGKESRCKVDEKIEINAAKMTNKEKFHRVLGHVNFRTLNEMCKNNLIDGLPYDVGNEFIKCAICLENKMTNRPFENNRTRANEILELVHTDLNGPHQTLGYKGEKYFLTFVDDYSKIARIFCIKSKEEVAECFIEYVNQVENLTNKRVKRLRCDRGTEYLNGKIYNFVKSKGICLNASPKYVHELNGTAEKFNRDIMNKARCLFAEAKVERKYWPEVIQAAVYLHNRSLSRSTLEKKIPYEIFFGKRPTVRYLKLYGSKVFVRVPEVKRKSKWDKKGVQGILIGYSEVGYRVLIEGKVEVVRHVDIVEEDVKCICLKEEKEKQCEERREEIVEESEEDESSEEKEEETLRRGSRERKNKERFTYEKLGQPIYVNYSDATVPITFEEAMKNENIKEWQAAMDKEISNIEKNGTWIKCKLPKERKPLDLKWVYTKKEDGRFRARLVVRGYQQKEQVEEIYSPVARMETLKILLSYCVENKFYIEQMDVETAFLNGKIETEVYVKQPPGYELGDGEVYMLKKALYGLKESPREGGEGEEPPEGIHEEGDEDEDEDEDDEDGVDDEDADVSSRGHCSSVDESECPPPVASLVDDSHVDTSSLISHSPEEQRVDSEMMRCDEDPQSPEKSQEMSSSTPPPPVLRRCSSGESLDSIETGSGPVFHSAPPRLSVVSDSSPLISPPMLLPLSSTSPPLKMTMEVDEETVLDFSTKRHGISRSPSPVLNLSKAAPSPDLPVTNGPLDLSLGTNRKREHESGVPSSPAKKPHRIPVSPISPWTSPLLTYQLPYFSSGNVPINPHGKGSSFHNVDTSLWNGKAKASEKSNFGIPLNPSEATKALEKMSELSKLNNDEFRPIIAPSTSAIGSAGRHSAWQSHWLNKGAEQAKDVLKCVWCKQSFPSLAAMTTHMQEAKHCGVNVPGAPHLPSQQSAAITPQSQVSTTSSVLSSPSASSGKSNSSDLNLLIKETMPLPRKLVRGQDVWLGKGAEQTRQILKCMWCGQSFRSLAEMTSHMQQTQHYTNIISQEQIISWKSAEEGKSSNNSNSHSGSASSGNTNSTNSHVSAVLTCKVCDQAFSSLKELSNHMVKNAHYKEHIMRSISESGGRRRQTREKRKKSLPVRKLLELERAQNELKNGDNMMMMMMMGKSGYHSSGNRITCEKCGEKIDMAVFVDHIRICVGGGSLGEDKKNLLKNALLSYNMNNIDYVDSIREMGKLNKESSRHHRSSPSRASDLTVGKESSKQDGKTSSPSVLNAIEKLIEKSFDPRSRHGVAAYPGGNHGNGNSPIGSSILKRLGIDESVDYTKPLMDASLQAAKAYMLGSNPFYNSQHHDQNYFSNRRERSGSESSSVSERGSMRHESLTPDRKFDGSDRLTASTPRTTPEKRASVSPSSKVSSRTYESPDKELDLKKEPEDAEIEADFRIKKEMAENENEEDDKKDISRSSREASVTRSVSPSADERDATGEDLSGKRSHRSKSSPALSPGHFIAEGATASPSTAGSPSNSERSVTPRSSTDTKKSSGSLGALSSMFDSLSNANASNNSEAPTQGTKGSSHPLAALQKLCDKTETHHHTNNGGHGRSSSSVNHSPTSVAGSIPQSAANPGAILAFSWACNDAVVTDSIMKCAFCDTPFISKGAYRHHLSKMHFVKDGVIPDPVPLKSPTSASQNSLPLVKASNNNNNNSSMKDIDNNNKINVTASSASINAKSPPQNNFDESPHSKFLKYTELAKQLSSKYM